MPHRGYDGDDETESDRSAHQHYPHVTVVESNSSKKSPVSGRAPPKQRVYTVVQMPPPAQSPHRIFVYAAAFEFFEARQAFIRRVFSYIFVMLCVVGAITSLPFLFDGIRQFFTQHDYLFYIAYAAFLVTYITLICCDGVRRSFPGNLITLGFFTVATGFITMCITMQFKIQLVLLVVLMTAVSCTIIICFSMQTRVDYTRLVGALSMVGLFLVVFGIVAVLAGLFFNVPWLHTVYSGIMALFFMCFLAIDIQMLMGNKKHKMDPHDTIYAAVQIFLDIVYIFWYLLMAVGGIGRD